MQNYCLKYAKQVEATKTNQNNLFFNSCKFLSVIFLVLFYIFVVISLSILQSDGIFVLSGTKNDIAGQKNDITGYIVFMSPCYRLIKAQVCDKQLYQHEWKLEKRETVWKHDARRAECFHTIS